MWKDDLGDSGSVNPQQTKETDAIGQLTVSDYFNTFNTIGESDADEDLR